MLYVNSTHSLVHSCTVAISSFGTHRCVTLVFFLFLNAIVAKLLNTTVHHDQIHLFHSQLRRRIYIGNDVKLWRKLKFNVNRNTMRTQADKHLTLPDVHICHSVLKSYQQAIEFTTIMQMINAFNTSM